MAGLIRNVAEKIFLVNGFLVVQLITKPTTFSSSVLTCGNVRQGHRSRLIHGQLTNIEVSTIDGTSNARRGEEAGRSGASQVPASTRSGVISEDAEELLASYSVDYTQSMGSDNDLVIKK